MQLAQEYIQHQPSHLGKKSGPEAQYPIIWVCHKDARWGGVREGGTRSKGALRSLDC